MRLREFKYSKEAEETGNWYVRVDGKQLNKPAQPDPFPSKAAARTFAFKLSSEKRIPLSRISLTKSWMDAPVKEAIEDTDASGYRIPRAHREEVGCAECGKTEGLEKCGSYPHVADSICPTCRKRYDYRWCENCNLNHIKGVCPRVGAMAGKAKGF